MDLPNLEEIKKQRRQLGLTQAQLARMAGVSQSLVAKIENGRSEPSYPHVRRIFEALERESRKLRPELRAGDVCSRRLVTASKHDRVQDAVATMRRHQISQLPVFEGEVQVGALTERVISHELATEHTPDALARMRVSDIMGDTFPQLDEGTPLHVAAALLQTESAVLVTKGGKPLGILTKADLLKAVVRST
ncbi:MAG TPA: CBS domain-containing protein [Candidatus Thermoplasmatota archaeon]